MAAEIVTSVAASLLSTLGSQVLQGIGLHWGLKNELEKLKGTISDIKAVLLDAEEKAMTSDQVRDWLRKLKEAMHDAEDLLDELSIWILRRRVMPDAVVMKVRSLSIYGLRMSWRIKKMRSRLDDIIALSRHFRFIERQELVTLMDRPQTYSSDPQNVVGREDDKQAIMELLLSDNCTENVGTVAIVGLGGSGKTALAQLVYDDEAVREHFQFREWVNVGPDFYNVERTVVNIVDVAMSEKVLREVERTRRKLEIINRGLIRIQKTLAAGTELREEIERGPLFDNLDAQEIFLPAKKFLLVLDDVWHEDPRTWRELKSRLNVGARGSRFLVTTRNAMVAKITDPIAIHELQGLSLANAWELFERVAFRGGEVPSQSQRQIGKEIIDKCGGNPLAIKVIGSLLYSKPILEWSSIRDKELLTTAEGEASILPSLKLSYDHLPSYLKHCFAYCSLFPKAHKIHVPKLVNLWIAQRYVIGPYPLKRAEAMGLKYFMHLLQSSFFQDAEEDELGNIVSCKMHGLMHDLAIAVAEEDFFLPTGNLVKERSHHAAFYVDPTTPWQVPPSYFKLEN